MVVVVVPASHVDHLRSAPAARHPIGGNAERGQSRVGLGAPNLRQVAVVTAYGLVRVASQNQTRVLPSSIVVEPMLL